MTMQAIITRFISPTNTRGSRYSAKCQAGSVTVSAKAELNNEDNHTAACRALCLKLATANVANYGSTMETEVWMRPMVAGQLASGDFVHVFVEGSK